MKVEFSDSNLETGVVTDESGEYEWSYSGYFNSIYSNLAVGSKEDTRLTEASVGDNEKADKLIDITTKERVEIALKQLRFNGDVRSIKVDGEIVF